MSSLIHAPLAGERAGGRGSAPDRSGGISGLVWLTWRQHRWALLGSLIAAAALTGWMLYLAGDMTSLYHQCGDAFCPRFSPQDAALHARFGPMNVSDYALVVVRYAPLLIGVFIGAPLLAREYEQRTVVLAWGQDVSPVRWLWTRLVLLGLFVAVLAAVVGLASDHLVHVRAAVGGVSPFADWEFMDSGPLPLTVGVCLFAVGVALGAAIRRTLPAMVAVVAVFVGLMVGAQWRYPTLMAPLSIYTHFDRPDTGVLRGALIVKGGILDGPGQPTNLFDAAGHELDYAALHRICPDAVGDPNAMYSCLATNHLQTYTVYQPAARIPAFHLILASGYLGLAAVALVAVWLVVRRASVSAG